jgi:glycosyltransferase involved in cell wall biosynthesis
MKIALVAQHATPVPAADSATPAGGGAQLVEMSRHLAGQGHQVTLYARRDGTALPERADLAPGVSVEYVGPAGIDTAQFTPDGPACERSGRQRLVTVADLTAEHDALTTLLRALAKIPAAELVIAGGPAPENLRADLAYRRLAKLSDALGLHGRLFFAGRLPDAALPPLLRSADLMVNINQHEATALTSIQAMACGTPVVAAANGVHTDAVVDGTTGIIVEPRPPALLAQKIRALLNHPMQLQAYSVAATDRARSRYSWDRITHETLAVYDTALAA